MVRVLLHLEVLLILNGFALVDTTVDPVGLHFQSAWRTSQDVAKPIPTNLWSRIFHYDTNLFDDEDLNIIDAFDDEVRRNQTALVPDGIRFQTIMCGSQHTAGDARAAINAAASPNSFSIAYASRVYEVTCWSAPVRAVDVELLKHSRAFFHVHVVPAIAKLAPGLLLRSPKLLEANTGSSWVPNLHGQVLRRGLKVHLINKSVHLPAVVFAKWKQCAFGLDAAAAVAACQKSAADSFFPLSEMAGDASAWKGIREAALSSACPRVLRVQAKFPPSSVTGGAVHISFQFIGEDGWLSASANASACTIAAIAFLVAQPEVKLVEPYETIQSGTLVERDEHRQLQGPEEATSVFLPSEPPPGVASSSASATRPNARVSNWAAASTLQSGSIAGGTLLWDAGLSGSEELVQVTDTGFDDASCFLRQDGAAPFLTGDAFSAEYQVTRSSVAAPLTDLSRRKVVQYLALNEDDEGFQFDASEGGHGTHVGSTIAGHVVADGSAPGGAQADDVYVNCAAFSDQCSWRFCHTSDCRDAVDPSDSGMCDTTCGFSGEDTGASGSGMAPGAKLLAFDLGDSSQAVYVPFPEYSSLLAPGYDGGARISSHSWGSGSSYTSRDAEFDRFVYEKDNALVVVAAGNSNLYDGDQSVLSPGVSKNVLTVGAAEALGADDDGSGGSESSPTTVAHFSSRGPTNDLRIKPDVVALGDPILSGRSSGLRGLASCRATTMSGTSMATPAVAGLSALLRQFLVGYGGHWHSEFSPSGFAASAYSASAPSAALLKALVIASTTPLTLAYLSDGTLTTLAALYDGAGGVADASSYALGTPTVDFSQGFGHVRASNAIPLASPPSFDLFLFEHTLPAFSSWERGFSVTSTTAGTVFSATLVWSDPPAAEYCDSAAAAFGAGDDGEGACLVHDLDLEVNVTTSSNPSGTRHWPNFGAGPAGAPYAGQPDTVNNVEKVTIAAESLEVGEVLTIVVRTNGLSYAATQKFAVVVTGAVVTTGEYEAQPTSSPIVEPTPSSSLELSQASSDSGSSGRAWLWWVIGASVGVLGFVVLAMGVSYLVLHWKGTSTRVLPTEDLHSGVAPETPGVSTVEQFS